MYTVGQAYPLFYDASGNPLENGSIYFGAINLNPETNPIVVFWDMEGTQPASQPIKTINGMPSRDGTPANIFANTDYSLTVRDKKGVILFYTPTSNSLLPSISNSLINSTRSANTNADMISLPTTVAPLIIRQGFYAAGDSHPILYSASNSACPLNGGAGDNGSQVKSADGKCWLANFEGLEVFVTQFGAKGDGVTDDAPAIRAAIAAGAGGVVRFPRPSVAYLINSPLGQIPINTKLKGQGRENTKILRGYSGGIMGQLLDGAKLEDIHVNGNATSYSGGGITMLGSDGNQIIRDAKIINFTGGTPLYFEAAAGSRAHIENLETWRIDSAPNANFAIVIQDIAGTFAAPKVFIDVQTGGYSSIDFGAGNDILWTGGPLFDFKTSSHSGNIQIIGSRVAGASPITLLGSGILLGDVFSQVTLGTGAFWFYSGLSSVGSPVLTATDGSPASMLFDYARVPYGPPTVLFGASFGAAVAVNPANVQSSFTRSGNHIKVNVRWVVSGDTPASGILFVKLPYFSAVNSAIWQLGDAVITDAGSGNNYSAKALVGPANDYATIVVNGLAGYATFNSPSVWANGSAFYMQLEYVLY